MALLILKQVNKTRSSTTEDFTCRLDMLNTLIGKKLGMTQVFDKENRLVPVTVIEAGPCPVTQVKTTTSDGYNALQIGFGARKAARTTQSMEGHFKKAGVTPLQHLAEVRTDAESTTKVGDLIKVDTFKEGQFVDVIGTSKGRGFQGVMKRFGFKCGPAAHGSMFHRRGGSYGMRQTPGHIFRGKKMPGHMGDVRRTQQNLEVVQVLADKNLLLIKGSIPGANDSIVIIRDAVKGK
jgi:large subunit ribosomal protein L3